MIEIYTDGACSPNPGKGGFGVVTLIGDDRTEMSGGYVLTTNNRMELLSIIEALRALQSEDTEVTVYSDSRYVVDAYSNRKAHMWQKQNWMRTSRDKAKNPDLWEELLALCSRKKVKMSWVAGHSGNEHNERCDELAVAARTQDSLQHDHGYAPPPETTRHQGTFDF